MQKSHCKLLAGEEATAQTTNASVWIFLVSARNRKSVSLSE